MSAKRNGTNGNGPPKAVEVQASPEREDSKDPRFRVLERAERSGVYQRGNRRNDDDPLAQTIHPFHAPTEEATMANVSPQEGSALAYMRTVGRVTRNPLITGYVRDYSLYTRSRGGQGAEQIASVLRAGQGDRQRLSLRERLFGRAPQPNQQQPPG